MKKILCLLFVFITAVTSFIAKNNNGLVVSADTLNYDCKSYILMDFNSGKVLCENKSNEKLQVASMVKLMTTLLAMEKVEKGEWTLETKLLTSSYAASMEGSQAFLDAGAEYTLDDLLKSIIVASANDSCVVVAENYAGSENNFVTLMNNKAKELGMTDTYYENSTGLPSPNEYSCAHDIALILKEVCKHDLYHKYATIWMDTLTHISGRKTELVNTNRLIKYYPGCDCGKTGFTDEAGYCLSASAMKNNLRLISVVIGCKSSQDRFEISSKLLNYGFANFESKQIIDKQNIIKPNEKIKGYKEDMEFVPQEDVFITTARNSKNDIQTKIEFNKINLPLKAGDVVGKIYIIEDGIIVKEINIISNKDHLKQSYFDCIKNITSNWR